MSSAIVTKRLISSEEYHLMSEIGLFKPRERVELINGEIYNMSPIGSKHMGIVLQLNTLFVPAFIDEYLISIQSSIHIDQWNEPKPDLAVLRMKEDRYTNALPRPKDIAAVIEVSDTSYDFDSSVKLSIYAASGIPLFWIANLIQDRIEVYSHPRSDEYANRSIYYPGDRIPLLSRSFEVKELLILAH